MDKQGRILDAIRCYLLGADHETALKLAIAYPSLPPSLSSLPHASFFLLLSSIQLRTIVLRETWDPNEAHLIIQMMGSAKYVRPLSLSLSLSDLLIFKIINQVLY